MKKDREMTGPTVKVDVTPLFTQGRELICGIEPRSPGNSKGGMLKLDKGTPCTVEFILQPPPDPSKVPQGLGWATNGAFSWDYNDCPGQNGTCPNPYSASPPSGASLQVTVGTVPKEEAAHYRLGFQDGSSQNWHYDPVIIRD